jgi:hypothetical protein
MTESGPFGKTICCHPELVSGSALEPIEDASSMLLVEKT